MFILLSLVSVCVGRKQTGTAAANGAAPADTCKFLQDTRGTAWESLEIARRKQNLTTGMVIEARGDLDHVNGLASGNGNRWEALELDIYVQKQENIFRDRQKLFISADPSTYQGHHHKGSPPHPRILFQHRW